MQKDFVMKRFFFLICLTLALSACQRDDGPPDRTPALSQRPAVSYPTKPLLIESVIPTMVETPAEALPVWRQYEPGRPILVLLANNPSLRPYPEQLSAQIRTLVTSGDQAAMRNSARASVANPLLLPDMALSAALDAGFFSQVIWQIPLKPDANLTLEQFLSDGIAQGVLNELEAQSFRAEGMDFVGSIRGTPFRVTNAAIPPQTSPVLLHIEIGYLQPGYVSEIRKPLHQHVWEKLSKLRDARLRVIDCTISYSNVTGELPLATRFLGGVIRDMLAQPHLLDQEPSAQVSLRAKAMYLENFFRKEEVLGKYHELEKMAPQEASVKYSLYQTLRRVNRTDEALEKLDQAVALDPVYGLEYIDLAQLALKKQRLTGALQMCEKAVKIFPDNPFITFTQARILVQMGQHEKAKTLVDPLLAMTWSDVYYPQMKGEIAALLHVAGGAGSTGFDHGSGQKF